MVAGTEAGELTR